MTIETDFYTTLSGAAGVTAIVGTKISPHLIEEGTTAPYITYNMVVGVPFSELTNPPSAEKKRIQVNCWSDSYAGAQTLAEAVKRALETTGQLLLELDDYVDDAQLYRRILDFSFIG